ncbi:MAG: LacI family DNA-binding transcriptional regulator [Firmicutes bacterium]|nr:LacI family DNA-binding transcriptional regulator [Bacillota bacterium]
MSRKSTQIPQLSQGNPNELIPSLGGKQIKNPTIKDVAAIAGVSPSTVGRVIGEYGSTSAKARERVAKAIKQLGYKPNAIARSLKSRRTRTLGYLLPIITNPFHAQIAKGIQDVANAHGYNVILCSTGMNAQRTSELGRVLLENRVDGIVLSLPGDDSVFGLVEAFRDSGIPIVVCHGSRRIAGVDKVMCDDARGGYLAAKHLVDFGHRRIGIIAIKDSTTSSLRLDGCRKALGEVGIDLSPELVMEVPDFSQEAGYTGTKLLLMRCEQPTAIIAFNDLMALGAMDALAEENLGVPGNVSVVGFDNTFAAVMRPRLTTVALPMYQAGQIAAQLLFERINGRYRGEPREVSLPEELILGGSSTVLKIRA